MGRKMLWNFPVDVQIGTPSKRKLAGVFPRCGLPCRSSPLARQVHFSALSSTSRLFQKLESWAENKTNLCETFPVLQPRATGTRDVCSTLATLLQPRRWHLQGAKRSCPRWVQLMGSRAVTRHLHNPTTRDGWAAEDGRDRDPYKLLFLPRSSSELPVGCDTRARVSGHYVPAFTWLWPGSCSLNSCKLIFQGNRFLCDSLKKKKEPFTDINFAVIIF